MVLPVCLSVLFYRPRCLKLKLMMMMMIGNYSRPSDQTSFAVCSFSGRARRVVCAKVVKNWGFAVRVRVSCCSGVGGGVEMSGQWRNNGVGEVRWAPELQDREGKVVKG